MLEIDVSQVSGSVASGMLPLYLNQILGPNNKSLISTSGSEPHLFVNEKIAGLPSYTGVGITMRASAFPEIVQGSHMTL